MGQRFDLSIMTYQPCPLPPTPVVLNILHAELITAALAVWHIHIIIFYVAGIIMKSYYIRVGLSEHVGSQEISTHPGMLYYAPLEICSSPLRTLSRRMKSGFIYYTN